METNQLWAWKLLTACILLALAATFYGITVEFEYTWRWQRVPQYFWFEEEVPHHIPFDGKVTGLSAEGGMTLVSLTSGTGENTTLTVETESLRVSEGEDLFQGDTVGYTTSSGPGPLLTGLWTTIWVSFYASVLGMAIGLVAGLARISRNYTLQRLSSVYIELIRGTPLLVQIYIAYYFIGAVIGVDRVVAGVGALALFAGAYVAEIIRAGIQSIPRGQTEAARSLGMSGCQNMLFIVLPQAFRRVLPPLSGQFISLIKDSSLVSIISITDLTKSGKEIVSSTFMTFEIWLIVAAMYLILTSLLSQLVFSMERRLAVSD